MFSKFTLTLASIILLIGLAGCSAIQSASDGENEAQSNDSETITETNSADNYQMLPLISGKAADIQLDASANGTTQELKVGEVLAITLESNITTGYSWSATISDPKVMAQMGEPQYQEPTDTGTPMVGAPGKATLFFQATNPGTTIISLEYEQSFESEQTPSQTINFTVNVK